MTPGLYIHIPFCDRICSYCDFCKVYYDQEVVDSYLDAVQRELDTLDRENKYRTIYIGGGTPSSLTLEQLKCLMQKIQSFIGNEIQEVSMEVNPESMTFDKLEAIIGKVTRLSIGVQTFQEHLLEGIERVHCNEQVFEVIKNAKVLGIKNISIDLMYGLPNQTLEDIKKDLEIVKQLDIQHLSYYSLILEDHTVLKNENYQELSEQEDFLYNQYIDQRLAQIGLHKYEVSNYSKPGFESIHNSTYWKYEDYDGVGAGAVAKIGNKIIEHTKNVFGYIKEGKTTTIVNEVEDMMFEHIMMSLRLVEGLNIKEFNQRYDVDFLTKYDWAIKKHLLMNTLMIKDDFLCCSEESIMYLNSILIDFME